MCFIESPAEVVMTFLEDRDRASIWYQRWLSQFAKRTAQLGNVFQTPTEVVIIFLEDRDRVFDPLPTAVQFSETERSALSTKWPASSGHKSNF
jgi:hypothetical protein